jgi:hypothetical protein
MFLDKQGFLLAKKHGNKMKKLNPYRYLCRLTCEYLIESSMDPYNHQ